MIIKGAELKANRLLISLFHYYMSLFKINVFIDVSTSYIHTKTYEARTFSKAKKCNVLSHISSVMMNKR